MEIITSILKSICKILLKVLLIGMWGASKLLEVIFIELSKLLQNAIERV